MGILARRLGVNALSLEDPAQPLLPPGALFDSLGLNRSDAGVPVNEMQAMRIGTAQTCVKVISEDLASNAHEIFQVMPDDSMRRATEHRLWPTLHDQPNPNMTAAVFWGALGACAVGWGNGYAWIKRDGAARVISLIPLKPGLTSPVKINGQLMYATTQTETGAVAYIDPENVLHIPGLSFDGFVGMSPVRTCMNMFGLALAAEKFGAQFFGNGARATGVLSHPGTLEEEAYDNLKKSVREMATGDNGLRPIILEEGMKWEQISIPPNDAQFIGTRQYQRSEIAGLFRVPLHMVGDLQRATNNNIEHQSLDYVRYCLRPWAVRIEQEVNRKLLSGSFIMEHNFNDMMRGDFTSQTAGFSILRGNGIFSANACLRQMRLNPIPADEGGDLLIVQGAMVPLSSLMHGDDGPTDTSGVPGDTNPFNRIKGSFQRLFRDAVGRAVNRDKRRDEFVRAAFLPLLESMFEAAIVMRFGNGKLTDRERSVISAVIDGIAIASESWTKENAPTVATDLVESAHEALRREILL